VKATKVRDIHGEAQFGNLLLVLDRKLSSVIGLSCTVQSLYCYVIGTDIRPPELVLVEQDFERRGRNLARRGIEGRSQNSVLPVICTRFELGT
jgi:hypothetical protein